MHRSFVTRSRWLQFAAVAAIFALALVACGGGGSGGGADESTPAPTPLPQPPAPAPLAKAEAVRFLSQATFGPGEREVEELVATGLEAWFLAELAQPATLHLEAVLSGFPDDGSFIGDNGNLLPGLLSLPTDSFWRAAIGGEDQLRQRMAFALSQILVVSSGSALSRAPQTIAHYMDILTTGAFGNYRDLLEAVTYSPAMAVYLTYLRNEKADPLTGRVPDENYARELLQLFTLGLIALQGDGQPLTDGNGAEIELYDNSDVTELAKVFTGLSFAGASFNAPLRQLPLEAYYSPLETFDAFHSPEAKQFLGANIPAGAGTEESIELALDAIFAHPNVGPFIGRQLIQRFVTSSPQAAYVERVAAAFDAGRYALPSGTHVGEGRRGDLAATLAAVLFDSEARDPQPRLAPGFGKLREPVLRFTHWARAFSVNNADVSNEAALRDTGSAEALGQQPYGAPSVFNFYRPGYIAPGTQTGAAELTAPELQITNATSIVGYPNFLTLFALGNSPQERQGLPRMFVPDYSAEAALADDVDALLAHLDSKLTHGTLTATTRERIVQIVTLLDASSEEGRQLRARVASVLIMTSPDYIVLR
tara:strand:- start:5022 stop:6800 length:1779 start_codon:yes stop_codon:yes gene_type:complete